PAWRDCLTSGGRRCWNGLSLCSWALGSLVCGPAMGLQGSRTRTHPMRATTLSLEQRRNAHATGTLLEHEQTRTLATLRRRDQLLHGQGARLPAVEGPAV